MINFIFLGLAVLGCAMSITGFAVYVMARSDKAKRIAGKITDCSLYISFASLVGGTWGIGEWLLSLVS